jgi:hypothetical protein
MPTEKVAPLDLHLISAPGSLVDSVHRLAPIPPPLTLRRVAAQVCGAVQVDDEPLRQLEAIGVAPTLLPRRPWHHRPPRQGYAPPPHGCARGSPLTTAESPRVYNSMRSTSPRAKDVRGALDLEYDTNRGNKKMLASAVEGSVGSPLPHAADLPQRAGFNLTSPRFRPYAARTDLLYDVDSLNKQTLASAVRASPRSYKTAFKGGGDRMPSPPDRAFPVYQNRYGTIEKTVEGGVGGGGANGCRNAGGVRL